MTTAARAIAILAELVAIPSVPGQQNAAWVSYVGDLLRAMGARVQVVPAPDGSCEGVIGSIGPDVEGGIALSGHVDVVDVAGQSWTHPPFELTTDGTRLYGRGTSDMKGFVACALAVMEQVAAEGQLQRPVHIVLSADEESRCQSALSLADVVANTLPEIQGVLVGEPTGLRPVNHHKGSFTCEVVITGRAAHASQPELGLSATMLAARLMTWLDAQSAGTSGPQSTTFTVGTISGGTANNIIAERCEFEWDIRLAPQDRLEDVISAARAEAERLLAPERARVPEAAIEITFTSGFPGFQTDADHGFAQLCLAVSGANACDAVPYGTEAGIFQNAGLPVMIMGPGLIDQAHIPDEFIERAQIEGCIAQLSRMIQRM